MKTDGRVRRLAQLLIVAIVATAFTAACSCGTEEGVETAQPTQPSEPAKQAPPLPKPAPAPKPNAPRSVEEQLAKAVEMPDFYPDDAPAYPGVNPSRVAREAGRVQATFSTDDPVNEVTDWLLEDLEGRGWTGVTTTEIEGSSVVQGFSGRRSISVLLSSIESGGKPVTLMIVSVAP